MDEQQGSRPWSHALRLAALRGAGNHEFRIEPDAEIRAALASDLDLSGLRKLRFTGRLVPMGKQDWLLEAQLGATVVQPCVATLAPVTTRIEADVTRRYLANPPDLPEGDEIEVPEDDSVEPLPSMLDLGEVMAEELALNLPLYPHVDGAEAVAETFSEPGITPLEDEDTKPFAGLAALRDQLKKDGD